MTNRKSDIAMIGMAVMGSNLALNLEEHGFMVSVYDVREGICDKFAAGNRGKKFYAAHSLKELVDSLKTPRVVMMMIKAGEPVDQVTGNLLPLLQEGDIIVDGGNSFWKDTERRVAECEKQGVLFVGMGVSGGETGARRGPSLMPGGSRKAWERVKPIFTSIAARCDGDPCCGWTSDGGAGHYVKMVHNGIEYGDMELICETWWFMKKCLGLSDHEAADVFERWNQGKLDSYLISITADILKKDDADGQPLVEKILDKAGQKGTGKWASQSALDIGVPLTLITESVYARYMSACKEERVHASVVLEGPKEQQSLEAAGDGKAAEASAGDGEAAKAPAGDGQAAGAPAGESYAAEAPAGEMQVQNDDRDRWLSDLEDALYAAKICSYAQGFSLLKAAEKEMGWKLDHGSIALMWRGGCIIRSRFLGEIRKAFDRNPELENLLLDDFFREAFGKAQRGLRRVVSEAVLLGIPAPALSAAVSYYDSLRSSLLPANLIQAQRDYFGAHTYERVDTPDGTHYHTEWQKES